MLKTNGIGRSAQADRTNRLLSFHDDDEDDENDDDGSWIGILINTPTIFLCLQEEDRSKLSNSIIEAFYKCTSGKNQKGMPFARR